MTELAVPQSAAPDDKSKNVVIFSDGTGQRGGIFFDEARTNIYKLYRATRVGPDSRIPSDKQVAFYDPGLGTRPTDGAFVSRVWRTLYNFVSQATGLGITRNIIDCYAAVVQLWRPGDRIYLFGFSRGAYTVRCLASVICYCGIPTRGKNNTELKRDKASATKIAAEAVKSVYQHVSSPHDAQYIDQRRELAENFRRDYTAGQSGKSEFPFFIGVFDTVAALSNRGSLLLLAGILASVLVTGSLLLSLISPPEAEFWYWLGWLIVDTFTVIVALYIYTHLKFSFRLQRSHWWNAVHLTTLRQSFYDDHLDTRVGYARHAISLDERRADFKRVKWGNRATEWTARGKIDRFQQLWFAGNHADIGGGYLENESRLSDIALLWMVDATQNLSNEKLLIDPAVLNPNPSPDGKQHDETRSLAFFLAGKSNRDPVNDATLHPTVALRFDLDEVLQYDVMVKYRPESLRTHLGFAKYYANVPLPRITCWQAIKNGWTKRPRLLAPLSKFGKYNTLLLGTLMEWRMDRFVSCLGLLFGLLGAATAGAIIAVQVVTWLMTGEWLALPLSTVGESIRSIGAEWVGLQIIYTWILKLPVALVAFIVGYIEVVPVV